MSQSIDRIVSISKVLPIVFSHRGKLLTNDQYSQLTSLNSLSDLADKLSNTFYGENGLEKTAKNALDLGVTVRKHVLKFDYSMADMTPEPIHSFLYQYLSRTIYFNLAIILKSKIVPQILLQPIGEADRYVWKQTGLDKLLIQVLSTENVQEFQYILKKKGQFLTPAISGVSLYWKHDSLAMVEAAFAKTYFQDTYEAVQKLLSIDRKSIENILKIEIEAYNVITILRAKALGFDVDMVRQFLVQHQFLLKKKELEFMIDSSLNDALKTLINSKYQDIISTSDHEVSVFENMFMNLVVDNCWNTLLGEPFSYSQVFAIIQLRNLELRNIYALINGVGSVLSQEELLRHIISTKPVNLTT